jgi:hypothetical protein
MKEGYFEFSHRTNDDINDEDDEGSEDGTWIPEDMNSKLVSFPPSMTGCFCGMN